MALERREGKLRPTLPRSSDLASVDTAETPVRQRDAGGRFAPGNELASGNRWKLAIAESLGRSLAGEAGQLGREAYKLYRAFLRDLPCDCASVRSLVAARARAAVLEGFYARKGAELGAATEDGARALGESLKWSARQERLAVTSYDLASKLAAKQSKVIDATPWMVAPEGDTK